MRIELEGFGSWSDSWLSWVVKSAEIAGQVQIGGCWFFPAGSYFRPTFYIYHFVPSNTLPGCLSRPKSIDCLRCGTAIKDTHMNPIYPPKSPGCRAPSLRTSQRQPLACQQCAKAKTRCDKTIPCYRCRRRGLDCRREDVIVSRRSKWEVRPATTAGSLGTLPATCAASDTGDADTSNLHQTSRPATYRTAGDLAVHGEFQDSPTAIEGLAWGRHQCHSYPHTHCRQFKRPKPVSEATPNSSPDVQEALPSVFLATKLVDYHLQNLCWYHNVLHTPTFLTRCENFWDHGTAPHDQWTAIYCAVLSSAAWTLSNSSPSDDFSTAEMVELAEAMMRQTRAVLYRSDFLGRHSIWAVQAICVISMVAHSVGESDLMATLVNAGIRIAQCLGLHRIPDEGTVVSSAEEVVEVSWEREVGRRVWWKLVELDYHSMPYTGTLSMLFPLSLPLFVRARLLIRFQLSTPRALVPECR